ncbi:MAG: DNA translocase FtsK [Candidatus Omnitrophica bacterium]|nr:DNA translocase FtsK [Candidatus Omnitrophota bacterium]
MKERRINEIKGVIFVALGLMILASLVKFERLDLPFYTSYPNIPTKNLLGIFGAYLGELIVFLFGRPSGFVLPILVIMLGIKFFRQEKPYISLPRILGMFVLLISISSLIGMFNLNSEAFRFYYSGLFGAILSKFVTAYFSRLGGFIIFATFIILSLALVTEILISSLFAAVVNKIKDFFAGIFKREKKEKVILPKIKQVLPKEVNSVFTRPKILEEESTLVSRPKIQIKTKPPVVEEKAKQKELKIGDYHLPSLDLLDSPPPLEARQIKGDLEASARILQDTLEDFGISVKITAIERGPVVTRYELEPAPGLRVSKIEALGDDIALTMKAQSVRIIAPIPGKDRVGIEVPNTQSTLVFIKEVIGSSIFQDSKSKLTIVLGKDIAGKTIVADLDDMPHLLIAGTTGSGKTVCINSLILSLLFKSSPVDLKFVMIDPKMVELMPFNGLPHLLCPVVTEAKKAAAALNWVVNEMEERYRLLSKAGTRNIEAYNEKQEKIPYIVVVVDEFADLMVVMPDQIETAVQRLAQLARAVGIHLILATQRPSVNVITGVIKANLPARLSFKVASKVDSRTVLDMNGADKLLGKGDMLFLNPGAEKPTRIQGALVSDAEIERVVNFVKTQAEPVYNDAIAKEQQRQTFGKGEKDELYEEAVRTIMESNQASVTILQRRMRLGYTRAARIIDTMEQDGLVGPYEGSKPRRILVDREAWLKTSLNQNEVKES